MSCYESDNSDVEDAHMEHAGPETLDPENAGADGLSRSANAITEEDRLHYTHVGKSKLRSKASAGALEDILGEDDDETRRKYSAKKTTRKDIFGGSDAESDEDEEDALGLQAYMQNKLESESDAEESEDDEDVAENAHFEDDDNTPQLPEMTAELDEEADEVNDELNKMAEEQRKLADKLRAAAVGDADKARSVRVQMQTIESLLDTRIQLQSSLELMAQLPLPENVPALLENEEYKDEIEECLNSCQGSIYNLMGTITNMRVDIIENNTDIKDLYDEKVLDEIKQFSTIGVKRSFPTVEEAADEDMFSDEYQDDESKEFSSARMWKIAKQLNEPFRKYRNSTIEKWSNKVLAASAATNKNQKKFKAINQNTLRQIETVMQDSERLRKRSQSVRTTRKIVGGIPGETQSAVDQKSHVDYYDDLDFYQTILKDMIEIRSRSGKQVDPDMVTMKAAHLKSLQRQKKKVVDTRASKGRKIRYDVHDKIVNFMPPMELTNSSSNNVWHSEMVDELFKQIEINFGNKDSN